MRSRSRSGCSSARTVGAPRAGAAFEEQARRWLRAVGESWFTALPPDAIAIMIPDVTGHILQAVIEESRPGDRRAQ